MKSSWEKMSWSRCWTSVAVLSLNPPSQTHFHQIYDSNPFLSNHFAPRDFSFQIPFLLLNWSFSRLLHRGQRDLIWLILWIKFSSEISRHKIGTGFCFWSKLQGAHGTSPINSIVMLPWQPQGNLCVLKLSLQPSGNNKVLSCSQA